MNIVILLLTGHCPDGIPSGAVFHSRVKSYYYTNITDYWLEPYNDYAYYGNIYLNETTYQKLQKYALENNLWKFLCNYKNTIALQPIDLTTHK